MTASFALCIPTANRAWQLQHCLSSLALNSDLLADLPVFVIDNNVSDERAEEVRLLVQRYSFLRYSRCQSPGLTAARHQLLAVCDCDVLCYVDDDVIFSRSWFGSVRRAFQDETVALAGGPTIPRFTGSIPAWLWEFIEATPYGGWCTTWLSLLDLGRDVEDIHPNWIWGLNFAIRRDVLLACGGFHLDLVPEPYRRWQGDGETGLTSKLAAAGHRAVYRQDSLLFHQCGSDRLQPEYFERRAYYQGICDSYTDFRAHLLRGTPCDQALRQRVPLERVAEAGLDSSETALVDAGDERPSWSISAADLRARCEGAWRAGYLFHQQEAAGDVSLRQWIMRENYLDTDLCQMASSC